ncbi:hypothetical protein HYT92_00670 [Candidatus Pacearchaeota archaeon]|nr:hypothetical protein [Candidatus Pacearchaeota archaeon]
MKKIKGVFVAMLVVLAAVIGIISAPLLVAGADNHATVEEKADLCPKIILLEEKYKEDFFTEEGHKFHMQRCTKEAVQELTMLVKMQQRLNYSDAETAKTFKRLCHAAYGNNIAYGNCSFKDAQNLAKEALRLDSTINDCVTLALAEVKERKECKSSAGGVCAPKDK